MKIRRVLPIVLSLALCASSHAQSTVSPNGSLSFINGDLFVERMGDGSATLTSAATAIFFDEYSTNGTLIESVALPTIGNNTSGNYAVTDSGSAASDGFLTLSSNGQYIAFTGYSANVGTSGVTGATRTSIQTVAGTLSYNGTLNVTNMGTTAYGANNIRSAFTNDNGTNVWTAGANSTTGEVWSTNGGTPTQLTSGATGGNKTVDGVDGQLYASNGVSILSIGTGLPTSGVQVPTALFANISGANITQFYFADLSVGVAGVDTLYMANNVGNTSAILKYSLVGGNWVATGSAGVINGSIGALGLTGVVDGSGNVTLYGTTGGAIFDLVDSSGYDGTLSGTASSLVTAPTNTAFRGIAFAPIPEPGETAAMIGAGAMLFAAWRRRKPKAPGKPANTIV